MLAPAALFVYCLILFFYGLGDRDLTSSHEARAAQNAQTILDEGHWLVPRLFDHHLELQKPPMYYWVVALIGWMRGGIVDVWAVRLPATLSALATVLWLYFLGVRTGRGVAGLVAALILASCLHFTWLAHVGRIDMPLTMSIAFALGAFHLGKREDTSRRTSLLWQTFGYASLGIGLLLKGPIAILLPSVVAGAVWLREDGLSWRRHIQHVRTTTLWWGAPLMLVIAAPWYLWANGRTNNQLWEVFFWYHNLERGLGGAETLASHPWWFYGPRTLVDLLPWSLALPWAIVILWRDREFRRDEVACQGLLWFGAIAVFLSCMRFKRADYLLPAYPGMALFLGACAEGWWRKASAGPLKSRVTRLARPAFFGLLLVYGIGWLTYHTCFVAAEETGWPYRRMAEEIRRQTKGPIIFFRAESHLLAYHVGQPLTTVLEWENLEIWSQRPFPVFVVMPEKCARDRQQYLAEGALQEVLRSTDYVRGRRDRPLVVLRNQSQPAVSR